MRWLHFAAANLFTSFLSLRCLYFSLLAIFHSNLNIIHLLKMPLRRWMKRRRHDTANFHRYKKGDDIAQQTGNYLPALTFFANNTKSKILLCSIACLAMLISFLLRVFMPQPCLLFWLSIYDIFEDISLICIYTPAKSRARRQLKFL